jgi:hypothetical protein
MIHPLECRDDDNHEAISSLLKDVSDENLKKLRAKTMRKILEDVRGMFFCGKRRDER